MRAHRTPIIHLVEGSVLHPVEDIVGDGVIVAGPAQAIQNEAAAIAVNRVADIEQGVVGDRPVGEPDTGQMESQALPDPEDNVVLQPTTDTRGDINSVLLVTAEAHGTRGTDVPDPVALNHLVVVGNEHASARGAGRSADTHVVDIVADDGVVGGAEIELDGGIGSGCCGDLEVLDGNVRDARHAHGVIAIGGGGGGLNLGAPLVERLENHRSRCGSTMVDGYGLDIGAVADDYGLAGINGIGGVLNRRPWAACRAVIGVVAVGLNKALIGGCGGARA